MDRERGAGRELADEPDVLAGRDQPGAVLARAGGARAELEAEPGEGIEGARDVVPDVHVPRDVAFADVHAARPDLDHRALRSPWPAAARSARLGGDGNTRPAPERAAVRSASAAASRRRRFEDGTRA